MNDGPEWFAPKRYGYGSGLPISWQGWGLSVSYLVLVIGLAVFLKNRPLEMIGIMAPFTIGFIVISARTTRGGWRWRWGDED